MSDSRNTTVPKCAAVVIAPDDIRRMHGYRGRRRTILAVDDNPDHLRLIEDTLAPLRLLLHFAENAETAVAVAREVAPDLFLLDVTRRSIIAAAGDGRVVWSTPHAAALLGAAGGERDGDVVLSLSPRTVNKHLEQIYVKLEVENRTAAAVLAVRTIEGA